MHPNRSRRTVLLAAIVGMAATSASPAAAQWIQENEQFYLPARHNWVFRDNYPGADRLFNAFDYGHAILYEELLTDPYGPVERLEIDEYNFLTQKLLRNPPRVPLEEAAIEVEYVKLAPEAKLMFEWAHLMHRQIYDVLADERLSQAEKDAGVAEVIAYYKSRPDIAFSSVPKSMDIMDGQYYSLAFREKYPKFNGLIWAYHWLQVGLYEPLMTFDDIPGRAQGVSATVGRFWQMLGDAPENMPHLMPMTNGVAPVFSARYPEAAIIFDNLHMMHDVISDVLASEEVPRDRKREEILRAAAMFTNDSSYAISMEEWEMMAPMMGTNNMGGLATGFTPELPEPTVAYGASMAGMDHSATAATGAASHATMSMPADSAGVAGMNHGNMSTAGAGGMDHMMAMHERMMADPVIRERVASDPVLQRMMQEMEAQMGGAHTMPASGTTGAAQSAAETDRREAMEFIVRLLSDPEVEARVHSDPELHRLWVDPEVQARLAELRASTVQGAAVPVNAAPAPAAAPGAHQAH